MSDEYVFNRRAVKKKRNIWGRITGLLRRLKTFDRRRVMRFTLDSPVSCVFSRIGLGQETQCNCFVYNISETGALLMTEEEKLIPGNEILIRFNIPNSQDSIEVIAAVVRSYRKKAQSWYYSAIRFRASETEKARALFERIAAHTANDK